MQAIKMKAHWFRVITAAALLIGGNVQALQID